MIHDHHAVLSSVKHSMLEERFGLQRLALQIQYPSEGIQICGVIRLSLDGSLAHIISFLQALALHAEVISIIIKDIDIVRIDLQSLVIGLV